MVRARYRTRIRNHPALKPYFHSKVHTMLVPVIEIGAHSVSRLDTVVDPLLKSHHQHLSQGFPRGLIYIYNGKKKSYVEFLTTVSRLLIVAVDLEEYVVNESVWHGGPVCTKRLQDDLQYPVLIL